MKMLFLSLCTILAFGLLESTTVAQQPCNSAIECYEKALEKFQLAQNLFKIKTLELNSRIAEIEKQLNVGNQKISELNSELSITKTNLERIPSVSETLTNKECEEITWTDCRSTGWTKCPEGYYLKGVYNAGGSNSCVRKILCCKPENN